MLPLKAVYLLLAVLTIVTAQNEEFSSRFHNSKQRFLQQNRRSINSATSLTLQQDPRFDPDVLNRFLEEYANKMKRTTERSSTTDNETKIQDQAQDLKSLVIRSNHKNNTDINDDGKNLTVSNDTLKKHKLYNADSYNENRNSGWVTLDAIPWSKSKISKWQANPTTQGPWPDSKPWDKPGFNKPWNTDFQSRPPVYEVNKPWQNKLTKPYWSDNSPTASNKPWYSQERPHPDQQQQSDRPLYPVIDKYEENPNEAQKWPPERPTWDRYPESTRPSSDIITDDGPPNFPISKWERPGERPGYVHHTESYANEHGNWNDHNDFSNNKFNRPSNEDSYYDRPHFSHYMYPNSNDRPTNHPSSGDGQWVLLSTNRGYSKSRQRSIKLDTIIDPKGNLKSSSVNTQPENNGSNEQTSPILTSKRQVRLTVLPSINGTNTTTSHGGLLEVERTFKTVEESQKEYEMEKNFNANIIKSNIMVNRRPVRNVIGNIPSSSAVLAAVGAGMLPATMAMMIPIMLGRRKKRSILLQEQIPNIVYFKVPSNAFSRNGLKKKN